MAVENNQIVSILYEAKDSKTSEIVDSNMNGTALTFMIGRGQIIPGLESEIAQMSMGESGDILVKAADAYGEYDANATQTLPIEQFAGIDLEKGMTLYGQDEQGGTIPVIVKDFNDKEVTLDFNHPLAGKDLMFSIHITMVRDATQDELVTGQPFENQQMFGGSCSSGSCGCGTGGMDDFGGSCGTGGGSCGTGHGHGGNCGF